MFNCRRYNCGLSIVVELSTTHGCLSSHRFSYSQMSAITAPQISFSVSFSPITVSLSPLCPEVYQCGCVPPVSHCEYCLCVRVFVCVCSCECVLAHVDFPVGGMLGRCRLSISGRFAWGWGHECHIMFIFVSSSLWQLLLLCRVTR